MKTLREYLVESVGTASSLDEKLLKAVKMPNFARKNEVANLLQRGADPNAKDRDGNTPLHF